MPTNLPGTQLAPLGPSSALDSREISPKIDLPMSLSDLKLPSVCMDINCKQAQRSLKREENILKLAYGDDSATQ